MSDADVAKYLRSLGVPLAPTVAEQRTRLKLYPTQAELDAIATAHTAANDGVRPAVRVLEEAPLLKLRGVGGLGGTPGSVPHAPVPR